MKRHSTSVALLVALLWLAGAPERLSAQGFGSPLTMQGVDRTLIHSAASRAAGGIRVGMRNDMALMFSSPTALSALSGMQVSIGGVSSSIEASQVQQYGPAKYYPNFSLIMEGLTGLVPDTRLDTAGTHSARDSVQRPFDTLGPNWSRRTTRHLPVQAMLAAPITLGEFRLVVGVGVVRYADLSHYFQNNNVLSPAVNVQRPTPVPLVKNDSLSLPVRWYQSIQQRDGSIQGYGGAIAVELSEMFAVGASVLLLRGSSDDREQTTGRGAFTFYTNYFRLDPVNDAWLRTGTSDYTGQEYALSAVYRGKHVSLGVTAQPPSSITRTFASVERRDSAGTAATVAISGEDRMRRPWRGSVGLALTLHRNLLLGLEVDIRPYGEAVYTSSTGRESHPWLSASTWGAGIAFAPLPWLTVRAGTRQQAETFEPEGNPLIGEPVVSAVYAAGCGITAWGVQMHLTYEYCTMAYTDLFQNNVNLNKEIRHGLMLDVRYDVPWMTTP